jgi:hypothetical protein
MGTLHGNLCTFMIIPHWILLRIRSVSDKSCWENQTHILCSTTFSQKPCCLWDNVEKYGTAIQATEGNKIRCMSFACQMTKATATCSEYVIFIAFLRQQWLRERSSVLRFTYITCIVFLLVFATFHTRLTAWHKYVVGSAIFFFWGGGCWREPGQVVTMTAHNRNYLKYYVLKFLLFGSVI